VTNLKSCDGLLGLDWFRLTRATLCPSHERLDFETGIGIQVLSAETRAEGASELELESELGFVETGLEEESS
jgi:hypothetical protein